MKSVSCDSRRGPSRRHVRSLALPGRVHPIVFLTKTIFLVDYDAMRIGTQLLSPRASREEPADGLASAPAEFAGADGTLLAVVPIPGTGTSLAIVGYPVGNQTVARRGA